MDKLQKIFEKALNEKPYEIVADMIAGKLVQKGFRLTAREKRSLVEYLKSMPNADNQLFRFRDWQWWQNKKIKIEFTEKDFHELNKKLAKVIDKSLSNFTALTEEITDILLPVIIKKWPSDLKKLNFERRGFEKRLNKRWGEGIDRLKLFLGIARELGDNINSKFRGSNTLCFWMF